MKDDSNPLKLKSILFKRNEKDIIKKNKNPNPVRAEGHEKNIQSKSKYDLEVSSIFVNSIGQSQKNKTRKVIKKQIPLRISKRLEIRRNQTIRKKPKVNCLITLSEERS